MSTNGPDYVIVSQVHLSRWFEDLQRGIPGWEYTVRDNVTGVSVPIFVPDSQRTVENVRIIIEHELTEIRRISALGQ